MEGELQSVKQIKKNYQLFESALQNLEKRSNLMEPLQELVDIAKKEYEEDKKKNRIISIISRTTQNHAAESSTNERAVLD